MHLRQKLEAEGAAEIVKTAETLFAAKRMHSSACLTTHIETGMPTWAVALAQDQAIFMIDPDFKNYVKVLPIKLHFPRK